MGSAIPAVTNECILLAENDQQAIRWRDVCPPPAFTGLALLDIEEAGQGASFLRKPSLLWQGWRAGLDRCDR